MDKSKILIVENEAIIALDLKNTLTKLKFIITDILTNKDNLLTSISKNEPDIILMDINLGKGKDGIELVKDIYKTKYIPVIYLTGFYDDEIINKAIKTNPVGYLLKPYKDMELKATILLGIYKNKNSINTKTTYDKKYTHLGFNYYFDAINKNLYYKSHLIRLGIKEITLLNILIQANGDIVSFETLENEVWENCIVSKDSIRTMIYRLRNKMDYKFIQSIPSFGFKL